MITLHQFNTRWYGEPAGILTDDRFFGQPEHERIAQLGSFAWVEYRQPATSRLSPLQLAKFGFIPVDIQISFRIGLRQLRPTPSLDGLSVTTAAQSPFTVKAREFLPFDHERFSSLPGVDEHRIAERYELWANQLIADHPLSCLQITQQGVVQGWFFSQPSDRGLNLALAMLHREATVSGHHLYHKSLLHYATDHRLGWASFSAYNTPVVNVYGTLGARFHTPNTYAFAVNPNLDQFALSLASR